MWSAVLAMPIGEPVIETIPSLSSGNRLRTSRRTLVMRWQCGHHVANISSRYGWPRYESDVKSPFGVWTEKPGAFVPTFAGGGNDGIEFGLTAAPLTCALRWTMAYAMIPIMAMTRTIVAIVPPLMPLGESP